MTATKGLPAFEGQEVSKAALKFTNVGDGLREALDLDPIALHYGDEVFYVVSGPVDQINHRSNKDEQLVRVHTVKVSRISPIDPEAAEAFLRSYAEEVARKRDEITGQLTLQAEADAQEREAADSTDTPAEVAEKAKLRIADPLQPPAGE